MLRSSIVFLSLLCLSYVDSRAEWVFVKRVIDGDTFVTTEGTHIRVRGIDTPETEHPTKGIEPEGFAASDFARLHLEGQMVWLDGNSHDKYGRRVASVTMLGGQSYAEAVRDAGYDKLSNGYLAPLTTPNPRSGFGGSKQHSSVSNPSWVNGYSRSNGTLVPGHWRNSSLGSFSSSTRSPSYLPRSTGSSRLPSYSSPSYGSQTYVKGYFRKDGTYVAPHTRTRSRQ